MKINIAPEYLLRKEERDQFVTNRALTDHLVSRAVAAKYPDFTTDARGVAQPAGMPAPNKSSEARATWKTWTRVRNAFTLALENKLDEIDITREQVEFLIDSLESWNMPISAACAVDDFLEILKAVAKAYDEGERAERAAVKKNGKAVEARESLPEPAKT